MILVFYGPCIFSAFLRLTTKKLLLQYLKNTSKIISMQTLVCLLRIDFVGYMSKVVGLDFFYSFKRLFREFIDIIRK
jgi:hypothetical protein